MSRVYFHTPTAEAALSGAERGWLGHLAKGPAANAWDLDAPFSFDTAVKVLAMVQEVPEGQYGANYLHRYLREAREAAARREYGLSRRLTDSLKTALKVDGLDLVVHGVRLATRNLDLNTALVAGSDPIALAAKIHGWCESHCWVEGPDRSWLADVIEQGLSSGLYRSGMGWESRYAEHDDGNGVLPLLRSRDDEPIVLSYSVGDSFPTEMMGDWMPAWPEGVERNWDALTEEQQAQREARSEEWGELPDRQRWEISMRGLRETRPWAQLSRERLRTTFFHLPVTVHDVVRGDRSDHLRTALAGQSEFREER